MLATLLKQFALNHFGTDPKLAWELMQMAKYLERWELINNFPPEIDVSLPRPDPVPFAGLHTNVVFDMVDALTRGPDPQPNLPNPVLDRKARLEGTLSAAKAMRGFADELEKEVQTLS